MKKYLLFLFLPVVAFSTVRAQQLDLEVRNLTVFGIERLSGNGSRIDNPNAAGVHAGYRIFGPSSLNNPQSFDAAQYPNTGSPRPNLVGRFGYNTNLNAADHGYYMAVESYFAPIANGQTEWYIEYFNPARTFTVRPFAANVVVDGGSANNVESSITTDLLHFDTPNPASVTFTARAGRNLSFETGGAVANTTSFQAAIKDTDGTPMVVNMQPGFAFFDGRSALNGVHFLVRNPAGKTGEVATIETNNVSVFGVDATGSIKFNGVTNANLGTPANGTVQYCTDCIIAAVCAGAGTGAIAKRLNGAWVCN